MDQQQNRAGLTGNVVVAATLFGLTMIATALIIHHGLTSAADRIGGAVREHGTSVTRAGASIENIAKSLDGVGREVNHHASVLSKPTLSFATPVPVEQPVTIQGPRRDGALPVDAGVGK